jgi:hypothetical protein
VWTADFLPTDPAPFVTSMLEKGLAAMKQVFENDATAAAPT